MGLWVNLIDQPAKPRRGDAKGAAQVVVLQEAGACNRPF